ncbi:FtsK/SpoIIIE domain-containing protein [Rhodococcus sp. (in: high G+C Gram-positive bacteria)]|uniref:FtsK/SpoIIIE domain-containing protein n=1 Tax=Rhodococcus sp. TaxID=1831 RepID=UPI003B8A5AB3
MTTAVELPNQLSFPEPGTPEFDEAINLARQGILRFGAADDGWLDWDLNTIPHGLLGGRCGTGKSVALHLVLFYAAYLPDLYEVIVCDPHYIEFTWATDLPNVQIATSDTEIVESIAQARRSMDDRQRLLNELQIQKLQLARDQYLTAADLAQEHRPVPKRMILLFDGVDHFFDAGANITPEGLKATARADLEAIVRLGRALEMSIVAGAQRADAKAFPPELRTQLGFRLGFGPLDPYESVQILDSTRFSDARLPKGRAWAYDAHNGYRKTQVFFLPADSMACPWDPNVVLSGASQLIRDRLAALGYSATAVANDDGHTVQRWRRQ